jgi:Fe-S cluster biosynthesis and repair protein YggX
MRGPIGEWIHANICQETWSEWIGQGTKVINEMRLDFSRVEDQETYERFMGEYLGVPEDVMTAS